MTDTTEEKTCVGKCLFCPLGDADKRGVTEIMRFKHKGLMGLQRELENLYYVCSLGEIGKDCIIPKIYRRPTPPRYYIG